MSRNIALSTWVCYVYTNVIIGFIYNSIHPNRINSNLAMSAAWHEIALSIFIQDLSLSLSLSLSVTAQMNLSIQDDTCCSWITTVYWICQTAFKFV